MGRPLRKEDLIFEPRSILNKTGYLEGVMKTILLYNCVKQALYHDKDIIAGVVRPLYAIERVLPSCWRQTVFVRTKKKLQEVVSATQQKSRLKFFILLLLQPAGLGGSECFEVLDNVLYR